MKQVVGLEIKKFKAGKQVIKDKTDLPHDLIENMNPITVFGFVHALLSLEYKKEHSGREWKKVCNCDDDENPHYHYVIVLFDGTNWKVFDKTSLQK